MRILAISAHADDETLGCGGTLLKHGDNDDELNWLLVSSPQNPTFDDAFITKRNSQISDVTAAYDMNAVIELGFPAAGLDTVSSQELISKVRSTLIELNPDRIYVVHRGDVHTDHQIVFDAVWAASKPFNVGNCWDIFVYETPSSTNMAAPGLGSNFVANTYSNVSDFFPKKLEILQIYDTELQDSPNPRSLDAVDALSRYRGSVIGVPHAEAFMTIRLSL